MTATTPPLDRGASGTAGGGMTGMVLSPSLHNALDRARQTVWDGHRDDTNFTGCGIGFRRRGGVVTDELVVVAMVVDKLPAAALSKRRLLPTHVTIDTVDYGVDVVEAGPVHLTALTTTGPFTSTYRPPKQGCGISNESADKSLLGTLGCYVWDLSDNTICIMSAGHVMGRYNDGVRGEGILQPAAADGTGNPDDAVAALKRYVPLDTSGNATVDVGIAQLLESNQYDFDFVDDLMPAITDTHPAIGMCIGSDYSGNSFLCRMDTALTALNATPMSWPNPDAAVAPLVGMNLEKVGRTSGYTSSTVAAIGVSMNLIVDRVYRGTLSDMIWSQFLHTEGDSGAVACHGGDGHTFIMPPAAPCPLMAATQSYYGLPTATADNTLTNRMQSQFLSKSQTGNLIIGLVYLNATTIINRLAANGGTAHNQAAAQAVVQQFYSTYRPIVASALASSSVTLTADMISDSSYLVQMLYTDPADGGQGIITAGEYELLGTGVLLLDALYQAGAGYQAIIDFMDQSDTYNLIFNQAVDAGTLVLP